MNVHLHTRRGRGTGNPAILLCSIVLLAGAARAPAVQEGVPPGFLRLTPDAFTNGFTVEARAVPLGRIGAALASRSGCRVEVAPKLRPAPLTVTLLARPPDRLLAVLARRAGARISVRYRFEPLPPGETHRPGARAFAREPVHLELTEPRELTDVLLDLPGSFDLAEGVGGPVRIRARGHPLSQVLDSFAKQTRSKWLPVVRLEERTAADAEGLEEIRARSYYHDLANLPAVERREELRWDLERMGALPEPQREAALQVSARDILALGARLHETPDDHRAPVWSAVTAILRDYWTVLGDLPGDRRLQLAPLADALSAVQERLPHIR